MNISIEQINALRSDIADKMSGFRLEHTLGVEKMAVRLGEIYCPDKIDLLRAAALLHDVTKELTIDGHTEIYNRFGLTPTPESLDSPATLHSVSASLIIPEKYPAFADEELISAVRHHTTGRAGMSICEKIIYLADYIEETRKYDDCIALRNEFFLAEPEKMSESDKITHLNRVILHSFDLTIADLKAKGKNVVSDTLAARDAIIFELENN